MNIWPSTKAAGWRAGGSFLAVCAGFLAMSPAQGQESGVITKYVAPEYLTDLPFGTRSHWLQPWRAYLDTWPASRLRNAVGINLQAHRANQTGQVEVVCQHLAKNGFRHVRLEFPWNSIRWDDPPQLAKPEVFDRVVSACKKYGLRPLFLLNANQGVPGPVKNTRARLTQAARKGDRTVQIDPKDLKDAEVGRTGLSHLSGNWSAEALFTDIKPDGTVTLSKPLPKDLPAGPVTVTRLKYLPFYPSKLKGSGKAPAEFTETMRGWLDYVRVIATNAKRVLGTEGKSDAGFDFEVWNELSFGSNYLDINKYYDDPIAEGEPSSDGIIRQTVAFVRDPKSDLPRVGVTNGFESQRPWGAGGNSPAGLTALSKHPYSGFKLFPKAQKQPINTRPLDALGEVDGEEVSSGQWKDNYIPAYVSYFPEYYLTGIQTETTIRDLAPITTEVYRVKHGREARPASTDSGQGNPVSVWITEVNQDPRGVDPSYQFEYRAGGLTRVDPNLTPAHADRLKAKAALRYLSAFVNKGVSRVYFFVARDDNPMGLGMISGAFFKAIGENPSQYPSDDTDLTSPAMLAVRRLVDKMDGDIAAKSVSPISLLRIEEPQSQAQFAGDPATTGRNPNPRPPLYNRDVVAFFPFQATTKKYVVPVYVMTRNLAQLYKKDAPDEDVTRFDMPPETFRLTIGSVAGTGAKVSLYDPLDDKTYPVKVVRGGAKELTVELGLTDSPRLLIIEES